MTKHNKHDKHKLTLIWWCLYNPRSGNEGYCSVIQPPRDCDWLYFMCSQRLPIYYTKPKITYEI